MNEGGGSPSAVQEMSIDLPTVAKISSLEQLPNTGGSPTTECVMHVCEGRGRGEEGEGREGEGRRRGGEGRGGEGRGWKSGNSHSKC